jgi:hypothetical protein
VSRFSYDGDDGDVPSQLWDAIYARAVDGKPGQRALKQLERALLEMPDKRLCEGYLAHEGMVCAIGSMGAKKMTDLGVPYGQAVAALEDRFSYINPESGDGDMATASFAQHHLGMTQSLAWMIAQQNDEYFGGLSPEDRWTKMLEWVRSQIKVKA